MTAYVSLTREHGRHRLTEKRVDTLTALPPHWIVIAEPVAATEIAVDDRAARSPPKTNADLRPVANL